jgi:hypothetical protein
VNAAKHSIGAGVALLFLVGACSGGTGPADSAAGRAAAPKAVTAAVSPGYAVAGFGDCPNQPTTTSVAVLNGGIVGLAQRLVPIEAVNVRICEYDSRWVTGDDVVPGRLAESALLKPLAAREFEAETNRQPTARPGPLGCTGPGGAVVFVFLTFANDSQQVSLALQLGACALPALSNGYYTAYPTPGWTIDLFRYAEKQRAT